MLTKLRLWQKNGFPIKKICILENDNTSNYLSCYKLLCPKTNFILETPIEKINNDNNVIETYFGLIQISRFIIFLNEIHKLQP